MRYPELLQRAENKKLMQEYIEWVEQEGHLTDFASSVLNAFVTEKGYTKTEYDYLAKEMGF